MQSCVKWLLNKDLRDANFIEEQCDEKSWNSGGCSRCWTWNLDYAPYTDYFWIDS